MYAQFKLCLVGGGQGGTRATLGGRGQDGIEGAQPVVPDPALCFVLPAVGVTVNTRKSVGQTPPYYSPTQFSDRKGWIDVEIVRLSTEKDQT